MTGIYSQGASSYANVHGLDGGCLCPDLHLYIQLCEVQDLEDLNNTDFGDSIKACRDCPHLNRNRNRI